MQHVREGGMAAIVGLGCRASFPAILLREQPRRILASIGIARNRFPRLCRLLRRAARFFDNTQQLSEDHGAIFDHLRVSATWRRPGRGRRDSRSRNFRAPSPGHFRLPAAHLSNLEQKPCSFTAALLVFFAAGGRARRAGAGLRSPPRGVSGDAHVDKSIADHPQISPALFRN